ncbi:uncharacterized protein LOC126832832 isoform X2 [Adelges cooleyi]|uniref:uncharacterized protein LOC126832832 isoform X2 n=1 Tax=Adelges cooleyi TaxID=133065 RepID=UPI00217F2AC2|nr:uncharacterized protein LOC126832832 isoform X2 [Adelges cooleyi]
MNILYILLPFALANVSVALDDYIRQVIMTTDQMYIARDFMPYFIQDVVLTGGFNQVELALLFSVPEVDDEVIKEHILKKNTDYQKMLEDFALLSLDGDNRLKDYIYQKKIEYQKNVQKKLLKSICCFEDATLEQLGYRRRSRTSAAIRLAVREVLTGVTIKFKEYSDLCTLIGVYKSIVGWDEFIVAADIDEHDERICCLVNIKGDSIKYYKVDGKIWYDYKGPSQELLLDQATNINIEILHATVKF